MVIEKHLICAEKSVCKNQILCYDEINTIVNGFFDKVLTTLLQSFVLWMIST